ncbi:hypothetical protein LCGC14_1408870 [marine sediment metagenome]|uniref:Uncharacterized protein n=1 Tax=marine sediment metagenome TaxID=412755 RepID=A0A0F9MWI1_9ZZZZ
MKVGDIVTFTDSSFSFTIVKDRLEHHSGELQRENWIVIAMNCVLPVEDIRYSGKHQHNDAIVQGQSTGIIVFTQERFFRLPIREVTMADVCAKFGENVKIIKG